MFDRFTTRAKKSLSLARNEAIRLGHSSIDTEHLLLGILETPGSTGASVLERMGFDLDLIRREVTWPVDAGKSISPSATLPFAAEAKKALEYALVEAADLQHNWIGTEHLVLGLIREGTRKGLVSSAGRVLSKLGLEVSGFRRELLEVLGSDTGSTDTETVPRPVSSEAPCLRTQITKLKELKEAALVDGDFERAAALREQEYLLILELGKRQVAIDDGPGTIQTFVDRDDEVLREGRLGLLCNHASFDPWLGEYLFTALARGRNLQRLFVPEHGLFAELQDQIPLAGTELYSELGLDADIVSLYGETEGTLTARPELLEDLDALVVDIHDVGSRYYTYATTLSYIFDVLAEQQRSLPVFVLDRPNPAGRQVEGTILTPDYASFVGRAGLPHRHGLTIAELAAFYRDQTGAPVELIVHSMAEAAAPDARIPPSPNMPTPWTPHVYSGQCLLEGTNLNEGRGTTRPFEIFGAPWLDFLWHDQAPRATGAVLRPMQFVPTFHKHAGQLCHGFQILLTGEPYHSLAHTLQLLRWIRERANAFEWRTTEYEFRSDRPAIEILAGDPVLLDYLRGDASFESVVQALEAGEENWIRHAAGYTAAPLFRAKKVQDSP